VDESPDGAEGVEPGLLGVEVSGREGVTREKFHEQKDAKEKQKT
jgi:hypothetical protein